MANLHLIKHKSRPDSKTIVNLCQRAFTALALLYSILGHAQFSGSFDPSNWSTVQVNGGNGSINAGGAPATIALTSPNGTNAGAFTYYQITPPCAGTITFDWSVAHTDPGYDVFGYSINGANSFLANTTASGSVSISVAYGQTFAFYGDGADGCCGSLTSTISNFTFTSSSLLFISSVVLSGTCSGQDTLFLTYQKCGAGFGGGNIFTVELSDTAGSFGSSTTILTVGSTSSSGTFAIPIASAIIGSPNYLVRINSTNPGLTSSSVSVPEFFSKPPTPSWVFSQPYGQCTDSTLFVDTIGNQYTTQTYPIGLANVSTNNTACGDNGPYSCAGPVSVTWTDMGSGSIISGTFSINYTLNCGAGDVLTFTLNGNSQGTQTLTLNDCACNEGGSGAQILTVNINPSDFNAGGSNTMVITNSSGNCFGVNTTGSLGGGAAQVSIIGYSYIAQYSFDSSFTTIVASGDTSIFNPGANTSVYVRYSNVAEGCLSYAALKPIIMDTGIYIASVNVTGQCAGSDSIVLSYDNCNAAFGGGNTLTFQLSDTFGNFSTFTSLGSIATTINSDTISLAIPASVYSGSNYKIRVVSSSPSDTSELENVPELFAQPLAPSWVFSNPVNTCEDDSVSFYDTINQSGGSGSTTYSLGLGSISTNSAACGDNGPYSCNGPITITWTDTGFGNLSSGNFSINATLNCIIGDALGFSLNGNAQGTASINLNDCSCSEFGNGSQILTVAINPADYIIGGTNSMVITMNSGNCVGINTSGALGGGAAQVDLEFSSGDIAQYSFDSNFTTIVASGDTAVFSVGTNTSVFVRTFNQTTGCASTTVEKSISFLPCDAPGSGYTVQYDGANDYATLAAQPTTVTNNFSIEGWVYPLSFSATNNLILYNGNTSTNGWGLMANSSGLLQVLFGGIVLTNTSFTLPLNKWTHIALVRNGGTSTVYANGISVLSGLATSPNSPTNGFHVGSNNIGTENFQGRIDEIKLWSTALSQTQIRNYMCKKVEPTHTNYSALESYYRCDANNGQVLEDRTANANNLTLMNSPVWMLSGAPIGNESAYQYSSTPTVTLTSLDGDATTVSNFSGTPSGAHVYRVDEAPLHDSVSAVGFSSLLQSHYFGVYTVDGATPSFDATFDFSGNTAFAALAENLRIGERNYGTDTVWDKASGAFFTNLATQEITLSNQLAKEFIYATESYPTRPGSGYALDFDGANDYLNIPRSISTDFTIEYWMNTTQSGGSGGQWYLGYGIVDAEEGGVLNDFGTALNQNKLYFGVGNSDVSIVSTSNVNTGNWVHVAATRNASTGIIRLYINGILEASATAGTQALTSPSGITIGAMHTGVSYFDGQLDEIRIWATELSQGDIRDWMCKKLDLNHPMASSLTNYYRFDEAASNMVYDLALGGDATTNNMDTANSWLVSGAVLGDESVHDYSASPLLSLNYDLGDSVLVSGFNSAVSGAQLYVVNEGPLEAIVPTGYVALEDSRYFGVFTIGGTSPAYSITYGYGLNTNISGASNEAQSGLLRRSNAADSSWSYTRFFTDSASNFLLNCSDTGIREFIVGFSNSTIVQGAAIGQNATVYLNNAGIGTLTAASINNGSFDTCGIDSIWIDVTSFSCADTAGTAVVLFLQNGQGYVYTDTVIVTAIDTVPPIVITQNFTAYLDASGNYSLAAAQIDNGSTDSCGIVSLTLDSASLSCNNVGAPLTVTLTATDVSGNISSATANITVLDTIPPTIITQNINAYLNGSGMATISAIQIDNGTNDACGIGSRSLSDSLFTCSDIGAAIGVTFYVTDIHGNTDSAVAMVTVLDTMSPVAASQSLTLFLDASGQAFTSSLSFDNGSTDNCAMVSIVASDTLFTCADTTGAIQIILTVTDGSGNSDTAHTSVTVVDTIAPSVITQNVTVYLDSTGNYSMTASEVDGGSTDNCNVASLAVSLSSFTCADVGTPVTVTLTATDVSGNVNSNAAVVTVLDTISPQIITQNINVYLDSFGFASINASMIDAGTTDACGIDSIYLNNYNYSCANVGANSVTFFALDVNGNMASSIATVSVFDTIAPEVITQNITVYLNTAGLFTLTPAMIDSGTWDSCGVLSYALDITNLNCGNIGTPVTVTLSVTDVNGNINTNTALVSVLDTIAPQIITQPLTIYLDSTGNATISAAMVDNGTWDSCGVDSIYLDVYGFDCDNLGANTVWFFALDVIGNLDSATSSITIVDTTAPQVLTQNITVALDSSGSYTLSPAEIDAGSMDACGIASFALDITAFGCDDVGTPSTVTLTVTDSNGNSATNTAIVTVIDTIAPTALVVQSLTVYLDSIGHYTLNYLEIDSASFDNCSIQSHVIDTFNFNCTNLGGSVTVTLTVTDSSGFTDTATTIVTILDTIAPAVIAQNIMVYLDSFGSATITAAQVDSATSDACGVDSIYLNNYTFSCNDLGANNITLFALDSSGNIGYSAAIVTVLDTTAPEVITQSFSAYLNLSGTFTLLPTHVNNQSWDSCGIAFYVLDTSQLSCQNIGDTLVVTLTVTDVNGNSNSATAQVFTFDTLAPIVLAQAITVYLDSFGATSISASLVNAGTWDSCGISSIWLSDSVFNCGDTTSQTITLYAADVHGNLDSTSTVVTILDTLPPVVLTTNLMLYLSDSGLISITASSVNNGSADNCAIDSMWLDTYVFNCADTGTNNIITLYVQDESGNLDSNTAIVQVFDTTSPTVITQNITIYLDSLGSASITAAQLDGGSTDNCSIDSISISQSTFNCSNSGDDIQVALSIIDFSGNFSVDTATVSVFDTIAPNVYTQPLTVALDSFGNAQITTAMVDSGSWDACGIDSFSLSQSAFNCADVGVNTVILSVTDNNGNVNSASALITIIDTIAPQIIAQNLTLYLDITGTAVIDADSLNVGTWDSCGVASLSIDSANFSCLSHDDTIAILFTAEDIHGNISTSTVFVHVLDTMPPVVLAIGDTVFLDSAGTFTVAYQSLDLGTFDNCTMGAIHLSDSTFDCSAADSAVAIWFIATDSFGNMDSLEVFITVLDSIHPIISCPDSIVVPNDAGVCGAAITFSFPTAYDNCSVDTIIQIDSSALVSGSFFPVGFTELFYVAYDQSGNTDTCSFIIEVQDVEAPEIICFNDTAICDTTFAYSIPEYTDNCSGFDVVQIAGLPSGVFYPVGVTVNSFEVTDSYGNSDTCSFSVLRYDYPSTADAGPDQRQCEDFDAQLAANVPSVGFGFWHVLNSAGNIVDSTDPSSLINSLTYGFDSLEWRIENGVCPIERDTMRLIIDQSIAIANAGTDQTLCDTSATKLAAIVPNIGIGHWEFSYDSVSMDDSLSPEALVSGIKQGEYTFTWSVENGVCPVTDDEVIVRVVPYPLITVSDDVFIFPPTEVTLEATSDIGIFFEWQPTDHIQNENEATAIASPPQTTTYWVTATTIDGCSVTDSVTVFVNTKLEIPTAFTPDGDNVNDIWNIKELQSYPNCKVSIFNRWGNLMFVSEGYSTPWDGTYNGEPLPSGAYFFVINLNVGEVSPLTGSITIIK